jgi:hypothetical protein
MTRPVVVDGLPDKKLWNVRSVLTARDHQSDVPEGWFFASTGVRQEGTATYFVRL